MEPGNLEKPFKVTIVGDGGVGKSSYIKKQFSPDFNRDYLQTAGYEVFRWSRNMSAGRVNLELWDVSGSQSKLRDRQSWLQNSDAAIIMVDLAQPITFENALRWHEELLLANPSGLPVVVCTWKPTSKEKLLDVDPETLLWLGETEDVQFYDVASDISRFDQPLLCIVRKLMNDPDASFWFPYTLTDDDLEIHD
ncbi:GTP-binding nuclear protein GSP1/Ran [Penicillium waksmanii]|uniref:GTP-binding nuclear protein GSP1/Ran n=1 Tax=Penicillium waksmanii TaxID=69791 RepID=UPI002548CE35|nr:GTP-binding nuclear protein GSP1/Ran [Penicillium waksmanii]KAJ5995531.1 GTP-binding nuclear protein GSP1/Ran [Penicillium waksmanii]